MEERKSNFLLSKTELDFLRESNNIEGEWDDLGLQDAILAWVCLKKESSLTREIILKVHKKLMNNRSSLMDKEKGVYRDRPVWVGGREGKPWYAVPALMEEWIQRANDTIECKSKNKDSLIQADHVLFENIHPFIDGNGRMGRILMNWERIQCGLPILIILQKERDIYYDWFE